MLPLKDSKVPVVAATMREHFEALGGDNVVGVFRLAPNKDECDVIKEVLCAVGSSPEGGIRNIGCEHFCKPHQGVVP